MRRLRRILFFILSSLCVALSLVAQSTIKGRLSDQESAEPIVGASIQLIHRDSKKLICYAISGDKGVFELQSKTPLSTGRYGLIVRSLGFETFHSEINYPTQSYLELKLISTETELSTVSVMASPVSMRGDTIRYSASAYTDIATKTLSDLLERLPGLSVKEDGAVYYQGKEINEMYVEGLASLGKDYTMMSSNLTVDAVRSVEILQDHQAVKALVGEELSDRAALNIRLREDYKAKINGFAQMGLGYDEQLLYQPKLYAMRIARNAHSYLRAALDKGGYGQEKDLASQSSLAKLPDAGQWMARAERRRAPIDAKRYERNNHSQLSLIHTHKLTDYSLLKVSSKYNRSSTHYDFWQRSLQLSSTGLVEFYEAVNPQTVTNDFSTEFDYRLNSDSLYVSNVLLVAISQKDNSNSIRTPLEHQFDILQRYASFQNNFGYVRKQANGNSRRFGFIVDGAWMPQGITELWTGDTYKAQRVNGYNLSTYLRGERHWRLGKGWSLKAKLHADAKLFAVGVSPIDSEPVIIHPYKGYDVLANCGPMLSYRQHRLDVDLFVPAKLYLRKYDNAQPEHAYRANKILPSANAFVRYTLNPLMKFELAGNYDESIDQAQLLIETPILLDYNQISSNQTQTAARNKSWGGNLKFIFNDAINGISEQSNLLLYQNVSDQIMNYDIIDAEILHNKVSYVNKRISLATTHELSYRIRSIASTFNLAASFAFDRGKAMLADEIYPFDQKRIALSAKLNMSPWSWLHWEYKIVWQRLLMNQSFISQHYFSARNDLSASTRATVKLWKGCNAFLSADYLRIEAGSNDNKHIIFADCGASLQVARWELNLNVYNLLNRKSYTYSFQAGAEQFVSYFSLKPRAIMMSAKLSF